MGPSLPPVPQRGLAAGAGGFCSPRGRPLGAGDRASCPRGGRGASAARRKNPPVCVRFAGNPREAAREGGAASAAAAARRAPPGGGEPAQLWSESPEKLRSKGRRTRPSLWFLNSGRGRGDGSSEPLAAFCRCSQQSAGEPLGSRLRGVRLCAETGHRESEGGSLCTVGLWLCQHDLLGCSCPGASGEWCWCAEVEG